MDDGFSAILLPFLFALGACLGSFLNVCIYRLPQGRSVLFPGSHCPACGAPIPWYLNVPIVSYFLLRGRCRSCGAPISPVYPIVEFLTGCVAVLYYLKYGASVTAAAYFVFTAALIVITFVDIRHYIIPDVVSLPGIVVGLGFAFFRPDLSILSASLGALLGGGVLFAVFYGYYLLTKREGMGLGDVKLLAMIGAFLGWKAVLFVLFAASLVGAVSGIVVMAVRKADMKLPIPFGPFLALGALLHIFFGEELIAWYVRLY